MKIEKACRKGITMVELVKSNTDQLDVLEIELIRNNIPYRIVEGKALTPPYLMVHGVPLDLVRAIKWIEESTKNE